MDLVWSKSYEMGLSDFDNQHHKIVTLINFFENEMGQYDNFDKLLVISSESRTQ